MSKETRRSRYTKTASTLRYLLNYGRFPAVDRLKYYDGYRAFELFEDRYGVWLKLMRGDRFIAILENRYVRIQRTTVYRPILEEFARRTNRRITYADRLVPTSQRLAPSGQVNYYTVGMEFPITPFTVDRNGHVSPRAVGTMEGAVQNAVSASGDMQFYDIAPSPMRETVYWDEGVDTVTIPSISDTMLDNLPF